jgi:hypothetical protein
MKLFGLLPWNRPRPNTDGPTVDRPHLNGTINTPGGAPACAENARASDVPRRLTISAAAASEALAKFLDDAPAFSQPETLRNQLRALVADAFRADPLFLCAMHTIEQLFDPSLADPAGLTLDPRDTIFRRNSLDLHVYVEPVDRPADSPPVRATGQAEDCLAEGLDDWSVFRVLNLALMSTIPPSRQVAIVTSVRNEGLGLLEWIAFHRSVGCDTFFVYTNDNTDGSDALLLALAEHGIIKIISNSVADGVRVQAKVLEHSLHLLPELRAFEWVFYIDVDEFFVSRCEPDLTLGSFFHRLQDAFPGDAPAAVAFNWKWFGSENAFEITDGFLLERFMHSIHNEHVKCLVHLRDIISMQRVHVPTLVHGRWLVNSRFERADPSIHMKPVYGNGQINHYWNKSFQEFVLKRARGRISAGLGAPPLEFNTFFDWGANGRRGNFDPPPERVLDRMKREYATLHALPGIAAHLATVRGRCDMLLDELGAGLDISGIYERRGQPEHSAVPLGHDN